MPRSSAASLLVLTLLAVTSTPHAEDPPLVRMALSSMICHDASSPSYNQIKKYQTFNSLTECVAAGGHLPKGSAPLCQQTRTGDEKALYDTDDISIVKKSRDGLCVDATSARFAEVLRFTAYANVQDCVADGGRAPQAEAK